jgi:YVTN family beta-propeller protein
MSIILSKSVYYLSIFLLIGLTLGARTLFASNAGNSINIQNISVSQNSTAATNTSISAVTMASLSNSTQNSALPHPSKSGSGSCPGPSAQSSGPSAQSSDTSSNEPEGPILYDAQSGLTYTDPTTVVSDYVTATEPGSGISGDGPYQPAYFVNGFTATGKYSFWYQAGIESIWPGGKFANSNQFKFIYEVFCDGKSIFPTNGSLGLMKFSGGKVNNYDKVKITVSIADNKVTMSAYDMNTGAHASISYSAEGATTFAGLSSGSSNEYGTFTGPMTEWYHAEEYYGTADYQGYLPVDPETNLGPGTMWMDQFCTDGFDYKCGSAYDLVLPFPISPDPHFTLSLSADPSFGELNPADGEEFFSNGNFITGVVQGTGAPLSHPLNIVLSPQGLYAYVTNQGSDTVSIINLITDQNVGTISLGMTPWAEALSPDGSTLYVSVDSGGVSQPDGGVSKIDIIDTGSQQIRGSIAIPEIQSSSKQLYPVITDLAISPYGTTMFGTGPDILVDKIDLTTNTVVGTDQGYTFVPQESGGECIDFTYNIGETTGTIAIDPSGSYVYVPGDYSQGSCNGAALIYPVVAKIDTQSLGVSLSSECTSCATGVAEGYSGSLSTGAIAANPLVFGNAGAYGSGAFVAANGGSGYLIGIPSGSPTLVAGGSPYAITYGSPLLSGTSYSQYVIYCNYAPYVFSPSSVSGSSGYMTIGGVNIGPFPQCPVTSAGGLPGLDHVVAVNDNPNIQDAYVTDYWGSDIWVINTNTLKIYKVIG